MDVYVERGAKRTFACAVDWPGWSRSGRDEAGALEALVASAPRFARALKGTTRLGFKAPTDVSQLRVVERLKGDATTDFGAPGGTPKVDTTALDDADLRRSRAILRAAWRAFDDAARAAKGRALAKGPRGGGEIPARGPRGGVRSNARRVVRRSAWHWLDHAWEIQDRSTLLSLRGVERAGL